MYCENLRYFGKNTQKHFLKLGIELIITSVKCKMKLLIGLKEISSDSQVTHLWDIFVRIVPRNFQYYLLSWTNLAYLFIWFVITQPLVITCIWRIVCPYLIKHRWKPFFKGRMKNKSVVSCSQYLKHLQYLNWCYSLQSVKCNYNWQKETTSRMRHGF